MPRILNEIVVNRISNGTNVWNVRPTCIEYAEDHGRIDRDQNQDRLLYEHLVGSKKCLPQEGCWGKLHFALCAKVFILDWVRFS